MSFDDCAGADGAGFATALLTKDMAASVLVAQGGNLAVQAFCLQCGAIWLPQQEHLLRAARGDLGNEARTKARQRLQAMIDQGSGFKLVSDADARMAQMATAILSAADSSTRTS